MIRNTDARHKAEEIGRPAERISELWCYLHAPCGLAIAMAHQTV